MTFVLHLQIHRELPECLDAFLTHKVTSCDQQPCRMSCDQGACSESNKHESDSTRTDISGHTETADSLSPQSDCSQINRLGEMYDIEKIVSQSENSNENEADTQTNLAAYEKYRSICQPISKYLEDQPDEYFKDYLIPDKFFRRFWVMDIVKEEARNCCCFTKR